MLAGFKGMSKQSHQAERLQHAHAHRQRRQQRVIEPAEVQEHDGDDHQQGVPGGLLETPLHVPRGLVDLQRVAGGLGIDARARRGRIGPSAPRPRYWPCYRPASGSGRFCRRSGVATPSGRSANCGRLGRRGGLEHLQPRQQIAGHGLLILARRGGVYSSGGICRSMSRNCCSPAVACPASGLRVQHRLGAGQHPVEFGLRGDGNLRHLRRQVGQPLVDPLDDRALPLARRQAIAWRPPRPAPPRAAAERLPFAAALLPAWRPSTGRTTRCGWSG